MRIYKIAGESWKERIMMEIFTARTFLTNKSIRKVTGMPNQPDTWKPYRLVTFHTIRWPYSRWNAIPHLVYDWKKFSWSQTSDNMDRWKSRGGSREQWVREEKEPEERRSKCAEGRKVAAKRCVFPMFCDLWLWEGRKARRRGTKHIWT